LKIALFHNYLDNIGGAERVTLLLARELGAHVYTTSYRPDRAAQMGSPVPVRSLGAVPVNAPWRQQLTHYRFRSARLPEAYDRHLIMGEWALGAAVRHRPSLWYVHSPIREIWDLYEFTRRHRVSALKRPLFDLWARMNRTLNRSDVARVGRIIANSKNTQARIRRYLGRDSRVIHPPVETEKYRCGEDRGYWLSVNRLISHKRVMMQLDAFRRLPGERLVIVGCYEMSDHFKAYAEQVIREKPANVEVLSWVDEERLRELYAGCRGLITTAQDEDFGLTAVEAMASGKPVIAPAEGGYLETVVPGETGVLIEGIDAGKLADEVRELGPFAGSFRDACRKRAARFGLGRFVGEIREELGAAG